jgi:hypothetical protein
LTGRARTFWPCASCARRVGVSRMPGPSKPADPAAIAAALNRHCVQYIVVGGWAAVTYGVDRATFDLDVLVEATEENARALARALRELDAERDLGGGVTERLQLDSPMSLLAVPLRAQTRHGPLDVLTRVQGPGSFRELRVDARIAKFGDGTQFVVPSKQVLESVKEAVASEADPARAGRDLRDLEELRALPDPDLPRA